MPQVRSSRYRVDFTIDDELCSFTNQLHRRMFFHKSAANNTFVS